MQCRMKVERISKNHLVNNLVEAYLKANPGEPFILRVLCNILSVIMITKT